MFVSFECLSSSTLNILMFCMKIYRSRSNDGSHYELNSAGRPLGQKPILKVVLKTCSEFKLACTHFCLNCWPLVLSRVKSILGSMLKLHNIHLPRWFLMRSMHLSQTIFLQHGVPKGKFSHISSNKDEQNAHITRLRAPFKTLAQIIYADEKKIIKR